MLAAEIRKVKAVAASLREKIQHNNQPPSRPKHNGDATVIPFPASAQTGHIKRQLTSVKDYDDFGAYKWLSGIVRRHRCNLVKLGVSPAKIAADVRDLEVAFGIESGEATQ